MAFELDSNHNNYNKGGDSLTSTCTFRFATNFVP